MQKETTHRYKQNGIALIMVMLVVAIASILMVSMASRQHIDIRRTVNVLDHEQAYMYLLAAEGYAIHILGKDKNKKKDSLDEDWAIKLPPVPVEGGNFVGQIEDLQARFNVNNIYQGQGVVTADHEQFKRLLSQRFYATNKRVNQNINTEIADAIIDWIDSNQTEFSGSGGEDAIYLRREKPYRTANNYITSASELTVMNGFSNEIYNSIKDFVTALPNATKININTASEEIIKSLSTDISDDDAKNIISERESKEGFDDVNEFLTLSVVKGKNINKNILSVSSEYFMVTSFANVGVAQARMFSIIHRDPGGDVQVILRTQREI